MDIDELVKSINNAIYIRSSPEEMGMGIRAFAEAIKKYNKLSDHEQFEFWKDAFSNPDGKDLTEEFARRHPDNIFNQYISK